MPIPFPVLLLHPYSTSSFPCSAPSNHANNQLCTLQPFLDSCAGDFLKWAQEAETRNRKSLVVLLHWFPLWAPDTTLRGTAWTMRPSCQGKPGHLSTNSHPTQLGVALSLRSSCSQANALLDPGGSPGTKQERPWGMHVMGCCQHAGDYAPLGHPSHQRVTGKWRQSGSTPATAPPKRAPTWLLQHLPLLPRNGSNFSAFTI